MKCIYPHIFIHAQGQRLGCTRFKPAPVTNPRAYTSHGSPLVLKFWAPKGIEGEDFTLTLEEDK